VYTVTVVLVVQKIDDPETRRRWNELDAIMMESEIKGLREAPMSHTYKLPGPVVDRPTDFDAFH
jgi:hypothetical protein